MARRYHYKSYRQRQRENRNMVLIGVAGIIVVGGVFYLVKKRAVSAVGLPGAGVETVLDREGPVMGNFERAIEAPGDDSVSPPDPAPTETVQPAAPPPATEANAPAAVDEITSPEAITLIESAVTDAQQGRMIAARDTFNEVLSLDLSSQVRDRVKENMAALATQWLFGKDVLPGDTLTGWYDVKPGDYLSHIARAHKVPYELLMKINGLEDPRDLRAGSRIKVVQGPFHVKVYRSAYRMDLYLDDVYVKSYRVGLGKEGRETPKGVWCVRPGGKLIKPNWTDPDTGRRYLADDPEYPLGSRWIALKGLEGEAGTKEKNGETGYAIHGTKEPESIGTRSSRGCIRLFNGEVIELYDMLVPGDSRVTILD
jgi:LysM repeat protein